MDILNHSSLLPLHFKGAAIAIGNFDGVHLGHQAILSRLVAHARERGVKSMVYTFWPHPATLLAPKMAPKMLQTKAQKIAACADLGIDAILFEPFDLCFAARSAEFFTHEILGHTLSAESVWVGYDFSFGHRRSGHIADLKQWGSQNGVDIVVSEPIFVGETLVSSTVIRHLLHAGDVEGARDLLGRPYVYAGKVVAGDGRGKSLGFPTANLEGYNDLLLQTGVYVTWAEVDGCLKKSVTNVGKNPTFSGERAIHMETHILDESLDLYGKDISLHFIARLRGEMSFASVDLLKTQIARDCADARRVLMKARHHVE